MRYVAISAILLAPEFGSCQLLGELVERRLTPSDRARPLVALRFLEHGGRQRVVAHPRVRVMDCGVEHFDVTLGFIEGAGAFDALDLIPTRIGGVPGIEALLRYLRTEVAAPVSA